MRLAEFQHNAAADASIFKTSFAASRGSCILDAEPRLGEIHATDERQTFTRIRSVGNNYGQEEALDGIANACFELFKDSPAASTPPSLAASSAR